MKAGLDSNTKVLNMRTTILTAVSILSLALASGCGSDSSTGPSEPQHTSTTTQDGLQLTTSTARASYEFGRDITITGTIKNVSSDPITIDFDRGDPARYSNVNVNVDDDSGFAVFVDGEGEYDIYTLDPGKSLKYTYTWNQNHRITRDPVDRGFYEIQVFSGLENGQLRFAPLDIELK